MFELKMNYILVCFIFIEYCCTEHAAATQAQISGIIESLPHLFLLAVQLQVCGSVDFGYL